MTKKTPTKPRRRKKKALPSITSLFKTTKAKKKALIIALFSFLTFLYFQDLKAHVFHIDEWAFIRKSYYFDLFFIKRDLKNPRWYTLDSPAQPKLGPYIYGLTLHLSGIRDIRETLSIRSFNPNKPGKDHWSFDWMNRRLEGFSTEMIPKLELIWLGRRTSVLFTLAALAILFSLGSKIKGLLFASLSTLLLGINPLMFTFGRRAMTDSMQIFFFFANLWLIFFYLKATASNNRRIQLLLSLTLGVNAALAVGVKVSGILIMLFLIILFLALILLRDQAKQPTKDLLQSSVVIGLSFSIVLVALHPYLYHNTIRQFLFMFTDRLADANIYKSSSPATAVNSHWEAAKMIARQTLSPLYGPYVNFRIGKLPVDLVLFITGLWYITEQAFADLLSKKKVLVEKKISGEMILTAWALVVFASLIFYLRNNWPRYFLPVEAAITIIQAYAITILVQTLWPPFSKQLQKSKLITRRKYIFRKKV